MTEPRIGNRAGYVRSRYFMLSPRVYRDVQGSRVRVGYASRTATLLWLTPATADLIERADLSSIPDSEFGNLVHAKAIVSGSEFELAAVTGGMRRSAESAATRRFVIMPTSYCNMACSYCGQEHRKGAADEARIAAVIARVETAIAAPEVAAVEVGWFGGEPLLGMRVVERMSEAFLRVADAHGKRYTAKMTSNGSLLDARKLAVLHDRCRLGSLTVTIDGPEEIHDSRRLMKNGRGTFRSTVAVLAAALRDGTIPRMKIVIRVNIDQGNEEHVFDLISDLVLLGLGSRQTELQLSPVHSWGNDVSNVVLEARRYAVREGHWLRYAHTLGINIVAVPNATKQVTCIATTRQGELIDSTGNIFSCTEHPLVPGYADRGVLANVASIPASDQRPAGQFDQWYDQIEDGQWQCSSCPLLPVCGGRCPKLWSDGHIPCPSMKFDWIGKLDLAAMKHGLVAIESAAC